MLSKIRKCSCKCPIYNWTASNDDRNSNQELWFEIFDALNCQLVKRLIHWCKIMKFLPYGLTEVIKIIYSIYSEAINDMTNERNDIFAKQWVGRHIYFHNFITPSRLADTSTGYFCVLLMSKSVTTSLWPGDGISGPDRGECSSGAPLAAFDIPLPAVTCDFVLVCTS